MVTNVYGSSSRAVYRHKWQREQQIGKGKATENEKEPKDYNILPKLIQDQTEEINQKPRDVSLKQLSRKVRLYGG